MDGDDDAVLDGDPSHELGAGLRLLVKSKPHHRQDQALGRVEELHPPLPVLQPVFTI